jgi:uncharacterized protein YbjT (DUF2867 family)
MKTALIAGATGLIGKELLKLLLDDPRYETVKAITRKPMNVANQKLQNIVVDFDSLDKSSDQLKCDDVFCCLGTTMKKAGSKEAFWKVDHDYPALLAKTALAQGAKQFLLVSALGANSTSSIYYNEVKGKIEEYISGIGFVSYHIFRPSLLLGPREESRPGEEAAKVFYKYFSFLIPEKYKGIEGSKVARAMKHYAALEQPGRYVHESRQLQSF